MLLVEQVRKLANEENLVKDTNTYSSDVGANWQDKVTHSITLTEQKYVVVRYLARFYSSEGSGHNYEGNQRCLLNGTPIVSSGNVAGASHTEDRYREAFLKLPAGTHQFKFQQAVLQRELTAQVQLKEINIGVFDFADLAVENGGDSVNIAAGTESTVVSKLITAPASRSLCVGSINKCMLVVIVDGMVSGEAVSKMKNIGESNETDKINWKIYVNGEQKSWTSRQDAASGNSIAENAYGRLCMAVNPGSNITIEIKAYNGFSTAKTAQAYVSIICTPWICGDTAHEPLTLDFPPGSTVYVVLEPFTQDNANKTVGLGKQRAVSFGDNTDYYASSTGSGILQFSHTMDVTHVEGCRLLINGFGSCVGIIGVDVR